MSEDKPARQTFQRIKLTEKPCAVKYVSKFDGFIVGTYDCLPDLDSLRQRFPSLSDDELARKYQETNHRIGSLNFLSPAQEGDHGKSQSTYRLSVTHPCKHGGIFDMSIVEDQIYAAHANGFVAHYSFDGQLFLGLQSTQITQSKTALLTSIDTSSYENHLKGNLLAIVGDSEGRIALLDTGKFDQVLASCDITPTADPVWQVKFLPGQQSQADKIVLVAAAAEDSSWYIYSVTLAVDDRPATFQKLYANSDFKAGVTSICFLSEANLIDEDRQILSILLGSYDESIRHYKLTFDNHQEKVLVESQLETPIKINGGGIWRLEKVPALPDRLLIAAMYAGTYQLSLDILCDKGRNRRSGASRIECDKICHEPQQVGGGGGGDVGDGLAPLHYGVDLSPHNMLACIVDYNNNDCIFAELAR